MTNHQLFGLEGKVAAVIGAGSGIGEAVALGCTRQGATVRCLDVDAEAATRTAAAITGEGGDANPARTAAAEFGPSGVRVNAVGPGVVTTPLTAQIQNDRGWHGAYAAKSVFTRWATADEMVGPTVFLASDAASFVTGTLLMADGGWTATDGRFTPPGM